MSSPTTESYSELISGILPVLDAVQALVGQPGAVETLTRLAGMPPASSTHASRSLRSANTNMGQCTGLCERHCTSSSLKNNRPVITLLYLVYFPSTDRLAEIHSNKKAFSAIQKVTQKCQAFVNQRDQYVHNLAIVCQLKDVLSQFMLIPSPSTSVHMILQYLTVTLFGR